MSTLQEKPGPQIADCHQIASQFCDVLTHSYSLIPQSAANLAAAIQRACNACLRKTFATGFRISVWSPTNKRWNAVTGDKEFPNGFADSAVAHFFPALGAQMDAETLEFFQVPELALPDASGHAPHPEFISRTSILVQAWPTSAKAATVLKEVFQVVSDYVTSLIRIVQSFDDESAYRGYELKAARSLHSADEHNAFDLLKVYSSLAANWEFCSFWRTSRSTGDLDKLAEISPARTEFSRTSISEWPPPPSLQVRSPGKYTQVYFPPAVLIVPTDDERSPLVQSFIYATGGTRRSVVRLSLADPSEIGSALSHCAAFFPFHGGSELPAPILSFYRRRIQLVVSEYHPISRPGPGAILLITAQSGRRQNVGMQRRITWSPLSEGSRPLSDRQFFETVGVLGISDASAAFNSRNLLSYFEKSQRLLPLFDILSSARYMMKRSFESLSACLTNRSDTATSIEALLTYSISLFATPSIVVIDCNERKVIASGGLFRDANVISHLLGISGDLVSEPDATLSGNEALRAVALELVAQSKQPQDGLVSGPEDEQKRPVIGLVVSPQRKGVLVAVARNRFWKLRSTERAALFALVDALALHPHDHGGRALDDAPPLLPPTATTFPEKLAEIVGHSGLAAARELGFLAVEYGYGQTAYMRHVLSTSQAAQQRIEKFAKTVALRKPSLAKLAIVEKRFAVGRLCGSLVVFDGKTAPYHQVIEASEGDAIVAQPVIEPGSGIVVGVLVASIPAEKYSQTEVRNTKDSMALRISREASISQAAALNRFQQESVPKLFTLASKAHDEPISTLTRCRNESLNDDIPPEHRIYLSRECIASIASLLAIGTDALRMRWIELLCLGYPKWDADACIPLCSSSGRSHFDPRTRQSFRDLCMDDLRHKHKGAFYTTEPRPITGIVEFPATTLSPMGASSGPLHYIVFAEGKPLSRRYLLIIHPESEIDYWVSEHPMRFLVEHIKTFIRSRLESVAGLDSTAAILRQRVIDFWLHEINRLANAQGETALLRHLSVLGDDKNRRNARIVIDWAVENAKNYLALSEKRIGTSTLVEVDCQFSKRRIAKALLPSGTALLLYELLVEQVMTLRQCDNKGSAIKLFVRCRELRRETLSIEIFNSFDASQKTRALAPFLFNVQIDDEFDREGKGSKGTGLYFCGRMLRSIGILPRFLPTTPKMVLSTHGIPAKNAPGLFLQLCVPVLFDD